MLKLIPKLLGFEEINNTYYLVEKGSEFILDIILTILYFIPFIIYAFFNNSHFLKSSWYPENIDEVKNYIIQEKKSTALLSLIQGIVIIIITIKKFYYYKANADEISLGILLKYLKNKNILDEDVYKILKQFRPINIGKHVDKNY